MPYGNYYRKSYRKPYRSRRTTYRRYNRGGIANYKVGDVASKALSMASHLYGIVNSELKHYDESNNSNPDSSTGSVFSIIRGMAQGDTNNTIDGNSILAKALVFRMGLGMHASATSTKIRIAIVWDSRPSTTLATVPAWTDVFSGSSVNALMNIDDQIKRFRVLHDKVYIVNTNRPEIVVKIYKKVSRHIKFTDSQVPNLNDVVVLMFSDEATNTPTVSCTSRLRYYDN